MTANYLRYACGLAAAAALLGATAAPASAQAIFTNGAGVALGIQETGAMGVSGGRRTPRRCAF